jgi:hypothetical protein
VVPSPCLRELSTADKTSTASQLGIPLLPYHIGLVLACLRQLPSYDGARISPTEYTFPLLKKNTYVGACLRVVFSLPAGPTPYLGS